MAYLRERAEQFCPDLARPGALERPQVKRRGGRTLAERHSQKVDRSGGFFACHPWTGAVSPSHGYGQIRAEDPRSGRYTARLAHVVAWELANGQTVPKGLFVLHSRNCTTRLCCNPLHLRLGTHQENMDDAKALGRFRGRLKPREVKRIVELAGSMPVDVLSRKFKVEPKTVSRILRGETWSKLTGIKGGRRLGRPRKYEVKGALAA